MKFGICLDAIRAMQDCPMQADYIELSASQIHALEPESFRALREEVKNGKIPTYSCNNLIDAAIRLTGPDVDFSVIQAYCDRLFDRLAELEIRMLVFGSGKSRQVPDGFSKDVAWEQLFEVGEILARTAAPYGQIIAVEPLAYKKVNILNTVEDGARYARTVNHDNFKVLVDFYHFDDNGEPFSSLETYRDQLVHAHFATSQTRTMPKSEEDWAFFSHCFHQLDRIGYTGALSFEGGIFPTDEFDRMILKMKHLTK